MNKQTALLAISLALIGIGASPIAGSAEEGHIVVRNFMFQPTDLTIRAGSTVTWVNEDEEPHTIVSATGLFRSGALDTHASFSFKFDKPGTYLFACSIHPQMTGKILVQ